MSPACLELIEQEGLQFGSLGHICYTTISNVGSLKSCSSINV